MKHHPHRPLQLSFASHEFAQKKRATRREKFLSEMEPVMPWARLEALIEPKYPRGSQVGRQFIGLPCMCFLQQWFGLVDEAVEGAIYDSQAMREFVGIDLSREVVSGTTTPLKFRRLLEEHALTAQLFDGINVHLAEQGLLLREGTPGESSSSQYPRQRRTRSTRATPRCIRRGRETNGTSA